MASLASTIRSNSRISVSVESHSLTSRDARRATADLFSDRRWCAVIEVSNGEPAEKAVEPTLLSSFCRSNERNITPTSIKGEKRKTTFRSARKALQTKSLALMKRSWISIVLAAFVFPIAIFSLLVWVDYGLLWQYRWEAMCGTNIFTPQQCQDEGFNLTCVADMMSSYQMPYKEMLSFENKGDGSGNNEMLDPSGNRTYIWPYDTRRPDYRLTISNLGNAHVGSRKVSNYSQSGNGLATWFENLHLKLTDGRYDCAMIKYDDCWAYCEKSSEEDCSTKCENLKQASAWLDANPEAGSSNNTQATAVGLDMCKKTNAQNRRLSTSWQPSQELIDEVKRDRAWGEEM